MILWPGSLQGEPGYRTFLKTRVGLSRDETLNLLTSLKKLGRTSINGPNLSLRSEEFLLFTGLILSNELPPGTDTIMRLTMLKQLPGYLTLTLSLILSGCGEGGKAGPATVPVSGTVYMDDKPLADAEVNFEAQGFGATARTNAEGKYQLVQGAVAGENKVYITKWDGDKFAINPDEGMDEGQFEAMGGVPGANTKAAPAGPKQIIPERFSDPAKTEIKYTVPEEGTDKADLRIQSK